MSELSRDALKAALERGRITDGSRVASQLEQDPEAIRTLARLALANLPVGPAEGEDEAAWATLAEADPLIDVDRLTPAVPTPAAFAGPEVVAPMAPLVVSAPRSRGWIWGVVAVAGLALGVTGTWWMMRTDPSGTPVAAAPGTTSPASLAVAPATQHPVVAASEAAPASAAPASLAAAAPSEAPRSAAEAPASLAVRTPRAGRTARVEDEPAERVERAAPATAAPEAPATVARRAAGGGDEADALLGSLDGKGPARPAGRPADGAFEAGGDDPLLPDRLSRQQILMTVKQSAGRVRGCKAQHAEAEGTVTVSMVIEPKGHVSTATVASGPLKDTPAGQCVETQVKTFRFPQFRGEPMRINMPFSL